MYGPILGRGKRGNNSKTNVPVSDVTGGIAVASGGVARFAKLTRFVSIIVLVALFSALLAGPRSDGSSISSTQEDVFDASAALIVFDVSGSVRGRVFDAGRDFTTYFLERQSENMQDSARIGLAFYSAFDHNELYMYRTPTHDLESLAFDLKHLSLDRAPDSELGRSRFASIPKKTRTPEALREAVEVLKDMEGEGENLQGLTIILIVDVHPESRRRLSEHIEFMADTIDEITSSGINVYVASITLAPRSAMVLNGLQSHLENNPRAEVFDILGIETEEEMEAVATALADMETRRFTSSEIVALPRESGISRGFISAALFAVLAFIFFSELFFGTARGYSSPLHSRSSDASKKQRGVDKLNARIRSERRKR
ncbi:MAG: vWA domain-containing protein [Candidatus Spechtbacterales bacterium]